MPKSWPPLPPSPTPLPPSSQAVTSATATTTATDRPTPSFLSDEASSSPPDRAPGTAPVRAGQEERDQDQQQHQQQQQSSVVRQRKPSKHDHHPHSPVSPFHSLLSSSSSSLSSSPTSSSPPSSPTITTPPTTLHSDMPSSASLLPGGTRSSPLTASSSRRAPWRRYRLVFLLLLGGAAWWFLVIGPGVPPFAHRLAKGVGDEEDGWWTAGWEGRPPPPPPPGTRPKIVDSIPPGLDGPHLFPPSADNSGDYVDDGHDLAYDTAFHTSELNPDWIPAWRPSHPAPPMSTADALARLEKEPTRLPPPRPREAPSIPSSWRPFGRERNAPSSGGGGRFGDGNVRGGMKKWPAAIDAQRKPLDVDDSWTPPVFSDNPSPLPRIQFDFASKGPESEEERKEREYRRRMVRNAFLHAWEGYKAFAWGHDELMPVSKVPSDPFNGWGASIVDALDTLLVMDLPDEYTLARSHVHDMDLTFLAGKRSAYGSADGSLPVFETAIRYLGGFEAAYDLSGDELMKERAEELAQLILGAFDTRSGVPIGRYKFGSEVSKGFQGVVALAEAGSLVLEYTRLWQVTGNRTYFDKVQRVTDWLDRNMTNPMRLGTLFPTHIYPDDPSQMAGTYTLGAMSDSYYEYLIKEHLLLGGRLPQYGRMYAEAMDSAHKYLIRDVKVVPGHHLLTIGESSGIVFKPKLDHLTCYAGAMLGLGSRLLSRESDLVSGRRFAESCWWAYNSSATGIGPEGIHFYNINDADRFELSVDATGITRRGKAKGKPWPGVRKMDATYSNRPETIESVFYMYRITGDKIWQDRGWQMFEAWVTHAMTDAGFSSIDDVNKVPPRQTDNMESFLFAETLKYWYLLFSKPDYFSLDEYVFSTEAHPFLLPRNGQPVKPGSQGLWSPDHLAAYSGGYTGGEGGTRGGMTNVQKWHLFRSWDNAGRPK